MEFESSIQLFISLLALCVCVGMFLRYGSRWRVNRIDGKVHLWYISAFATLLIMEFVVYICIGNDQKNDIISTISFGATLSSLIMSVLAIIYTLMSGKDGKEQLGKINDATDTLKSTATDLTKFSEIAQKIERKTNELSNKIDDLKNGQIDTQTRIDQLSKHQQTIETRMVNSKRAAQNNAGTESFGPSVWQNFMKNTSYFGCLSLLATEYAHKSGKNKFDYKELSELLDSGNLASYMTGFIMASKALNIVDTDVNIKDNLIIVNGVADGLEGMCLKRVVAKFDQHSNDQQFRKFMLSMLNNLRQYFDLDPMTEEELKNNTESGVTDGKE